MVTITRLTLIIAMLVFWCLNARAGWFTKTEEQNKAAKEDHDRRARVALALAAAEVCAHEPPTTTTPVRLDWSMESNEVKDPAEPEDDKCCCSCGGRCLCDRKKCPRVCPVNPPVPAPVPQTIPKEMPKHEAKPQTKAQGPVIYSVKFDGTGRQYLQGNDGSVLWPAAGYQFGPLSSCKNGQCQPR